jgi:hypothetical protein
VNLDAAHGAGIFKGEGSPMFMFTKNYLQDNDTFWFLEFSLRNRKMMTAGLFSLMAFLLVITGFSLTLV